MSVQFDSLPLVILHCGVVSCVLRERLRHCGRSATLLSSLTCVVLDPVVVVRGQ